MKLEAITTCLDYADFLSVTAGENRHLFDRWLIVTSARDKATREVCRRFNLDCLVTEDNLREGPFSKGRMIERGLQHLRADGWRLHLDADMILPRSARHALEVAHLDPSCIYGIDRVLVKSWEQWLKVKASGYLETQHDYHCRIRWPDLPLELGTRWASPREGYVPIGAFQLWHSDEDQWAGIRSKPYPKDHGNACRTDIQHGLQWDRRKRILLPEIIGVHLQSEPCANGTNWSGRTTRRFGPPAMSRAPQPGSA